MLKVAYHAYLHTLVVILSQSLLSPQQLSQLLPQSLESIIDALAQRGLDVVLNKLSEAGYHLLPAGNMDNLFLSILLQDCRSIIRSLSAKEQDFFIYWARRFELQNLKTILRGKSLQHSTEQIRNELTQLDGFSVLPVEELLNCDDIGEILGHLKQTPYAAIARYSEDNYEQKQDLFSVETSINWQYFNGLNQRLKLLRKDEQEEIQRLLGSYIDQINLIWLLRYRLIYGLSVSHSYFLLVPGGLHLKANHLMQLSKIEKIEQVFSYLPEKLQLLLSGCHSIYEIEQRMERNLLFVSNQVLKSQAFSLAQAFAYLLIREKQLFQIHALLKGKLLLLNDKQIALAMGERE